MVRGSTGCGRLQASRPTSEGGGLRRRGDSRGQRLPHRRLPPVEDERTNGQLRRERGESLSFSQRSCRSSHVRLARPPSRRAALAERDVQRHGVVRRERRDTRISRPTPSPPPRVNARTSRGSGAARQADGPRGVVFCRVKGARYEQSQVAKFVSQGFSGNAQQAGVFLLIAVRILQAVRQEEPVHLTVGFGGEGL